VTESSPEADAESAPAEARPALMVVDGNATAEEVAALVAVVQGMASAAAAAEPPVRRRSTWADPARRVRRPLAAGPGGWRASSLPS
jgi:Acyl-CoA carboxylase epsilon subunit